MINEFISLRSIDVPEGETESPLTKEMNESRDSQVGIYWGAFTKAKRDLQGSILTGVIAKCQCFTTPNVQAVTSSFAEAGLIPRAAIDLNMLRNPSTAIYVVIPRATQIATAHSSLLSRTRDERPQDTPCDPQDCPALFMFDEAGNVPSTG